jgi:hypothetical protein
LHNALDTGIAMGRHQLDLRRHDRSVLGRGSVEK